MAKNEAPEYWAMAYRADGRVELACPHGVGHTSRRLSKARGRVKLDAYNDVYFSAHGCDGCCGKDDFYNSEEYHLKKGEF